MISDKIKVNYYEKYLKSRRFTWKVQVDNKGKVNILYKIVINGIIDVINDEIMARRLKW